MAFGLGAQDHAWQRGRWRRTYGRHSRDHHHPPKDMMRISAVQKRSYHMPGSAPSFCSLLFLWVISISLDDSYETMLSQSTHIVGWHFSIGPVVFLFLGQHHLDSYWIPTKGLKVVRVPSYVPALSWSSSSDHWRVEAHWYAGPCPGSLVPELMIQQWVRVSLEEVSP